MAADCTAHGSLVLFQIPMDNCPVLSGNGMYRELLCEALAGEIALTDNQGTRCVHIDSVDDSGAQNAVDAGEISAAVIQNRIAQCSAAVACRRMYDHPLGLIDDQKIIILVQNIKRNVFWLHVQFFRFRQKHQNGITGGVGNSLFAPNPPCPRAQIVTFLWRAAGSPVVNYLMPFTEVDEGAYYAEAVRWAASTGIVTGLTETTFGTDSVCTRAQAAAMIYRCAQAQGKGFTGAWMFHLPFTDVPEWAYESVAWCYMNGVTTGVNETAFAPGNDCTRAQIVTFLWRAFSK